MFVVLFLSRWTLAEINGFKFFETKSDPTILFQNAIQVEDDRNASKAVPKLKSYLPDLRKQFQTSCNDRSSTCMMIELLDQHTNKN